MGYTTDYILFTVVEWYIIFIPILLFFGIGYFLTKSKMEKGDDIWSTRNQYRMIIPFLRLTAFYMIPIIIYAYFVPHEILVTGRSAVELQRLTGQKAYLTTEPAIGKFIVSMLIWCIGPLLISFSKFVKEMSK